MPVLLQFVRDNCWSVVCCHGIRQLSATGSKARAFESIMKLSCRGHRASRTAGMVPYGATAALTCVALGGCSRLARGVDDGASAVGRGSNTQCQGEGAG